MAKELPSAEVLWSLLDYKENGDLIWKPRGQDGFDRRFAGKIACCNDGWKGYLKVRVQGSYVYAHRAIWKMHYNLEPGVIDHVNGKKDDNRIENLRASDNFTNQHNTRRKSAATGFKGVIAASRYEAYEARITVYGKKIHIGTFATAELAALEYDKAALEHFGEFAVTNADLGLLPSV